MFTNISWGDYLTAISALLAIWYLVLGLWFYYPELKQILHGEKNIKALGFKNNSQPYFTHHLPKDTNTEIQVSSSGTETQDTLQETEELSERIISAIEESAQRNLSLEEIKNYLKILLSEYPFVRLSTLRAKVSGLMVEQCAKHPQLFLTLSQADALWEE